MTGVGPTHSPARRALAGVVVLLVLIAAVLAARELVGTAPDRQVGLRVTRDIAPLEILRPDDVVRDDRAPAAEPLATERTAAVGHYVLGGLRADDPLPRRLVGPAAVPELTVSRVVLASGGFEVSLNGRLVGGDRVDVVFPPRPTGPRQVRTVPRALVLDVQSPRPEFWVVTLAIGPATDGEQIAALASGRAYLVKVPR